MAPSFGAIQQCLSGQFKNFILSLLHQHLERHSELSELLEQQQFQTTVELMQNLYFP